MVVTEKEFDFFREWALSHAAISLQPDKDYLIRTRLDPLVRRHKMTNLTALMEALSERYPSRSLVEETLDAFTTNETLFFRDKSPFEAMREKLLPEIIKRNESSRRLRIWSAACSTGQEIYSIAMLIRTHFPELLSWDLDLMATDVSASALQKASSALYSEMEVGRGLDPSYRERYFDRESTDAFRVTEALRSMVTFRRLNFIESWPNIGVFDLVLIRNVLIYFEPQMKRYILDRVKSRLAPEGYMLLGTAETTINIDRSWHVNRDGTATYFTL